MIPELYDKYTTRQPLGVLQGCISCTVTEEINGVYECEFQYPISGEFFNYLTNIGGIISAMTSRRRGAQFFDIYKYSAPINGIVTFYASHVSYRLNNVIVKGGWSASTPDEAAQKITANIVTNDEGFTLHVGSPWDGDAGEMSPIAYSNVRSLLLNREQGAQSMLSAWKIEFDFKNFDIYYSTEIGYHRGFQIRYGKNMTNVLREKDTGGIVSQIYPYWKDQDGNYVAANPVTSPKVEAGQSPWTYPYTYINPDGPPLPTYFDLPMKSSGEQIYFRPAQIRAAVVDFSEQFQTQPTTAELQSAALTYMRKNSTWRSNDNITVEFADLYTAPEYADIKNLEECDLGDFVGVYYEELGIVAENVEIVSATFDTLAEKYVSMQLNTIRTTLAQTIIDYLTGGKK